MSLEWGKLQSWRFLLESIKGDMIRCHGTRLMRNAMNHVSDVMSISPDPRLAYELLRSRSVHSRSDRIALDLFERFILEVGSRD